MAKKNAQVAVTLQEMARSEVQPAVQDYSIESFIEKAISTGASIDTLYSLYALKEKVDAANAKKSYIEAVSGFQKDCPIIEKTKKVMNKDGRSIRYQFAPLDSIIEQTKVALAAHGLSYRWEVKDSDRGVEVTCIVTHSFGHQESSTFTIPIDEEGYMTAPQKKASALTFAKRYSFTNVLGIATGDEDDDATTAKKEADAKDPKAKIVLRLRTLGEKTDTKENIEEAVKRLTTLALVPDDFSEIITRLEVIISDRNEASI